MKESIDEVYAKDMKRIIMPSYPSIDTQKQFVKLFKEEYKEKISGVLEWDKEPSTSDDRCWQKELQQAYGKVFYEVLKEAEQIMKDDTLVKKIVDYFHIYDIPIAEKDRIMDTEIDIRLPHVKPYKKFDCVIQSLISGSKSIKEDYEGVVKILKQHIDVPKIPSDVFIIHQTEVCWAADGSKDMMIEHLLGIDKRTIHTYTSCQYCIDEIDTSSSRWKSLIDLGLICVGRCDAQPYADIPADFYHMDKVYEKIEQ